MKEKFWDQIVGLEDNISELNQKIKNHSQRISESDLNVLSIAVNKINTDIRDVRLTFNVYLTSVYDDDTFYINKISNDLEHLSNNYNIVDHLYTIAIDKDRESLLQYLRYNKPYK